MSNKPDRLNLRCSAAASATLRKAAALQNQDLTSFILGAALDRARVVVSQDHALRLTAHEAPEVHSAPDAPAHAHAPPPAEAEPDLDAEPDLADVMRTFRRGQQEYAESQSRL